jgi:hypothetical protein
MNAEEQAVLDRLCECRSRGLIYKSIRRLDRPSRAAVKALRFRGLIALHSYRPSDSAMAAWRGRVEETVAALAPLALPAAPADVPLKKAARASAPQPPIQLRELLSILTAAAEAGVPAPSNSELCDQADLATASRASQAVSQLEALGFIRVTRSANKRRITIVASGKQTAEPVCPSTKAPLWERPSPPPRQVPRGAAAVAAPASSVRTFCDQCERRVRAAEAQACASRFCKAKGIV